MPSNPFEPFGPPPRTPVNPVNPVPAPTPAPSWSAASVAPWLLLVAVAGWYFWTRNAGPAPGPGPANATAAGRALGVAVSGALADGYDAYLAALAAGVDESAAQAALQSRWQEARTAAHRAHAQPVLSAILPAGAEFADAAQKTRYLAAIKAIQAGLRQVK